MLSNEMIKEAAACQVNTELDKLFRLQCANLPNELKNACKQLDAFLRRSLADTFDRQDLKKLRQDIDAISELIALFRAASGERSSWWAQPLIKECYEKLALDCSNRTLLIIHSEDIASFVVYPNILSYFGQYFTQHTPIPVIDIFQIPSEAKFDLSSIALIAHEVGHVYFQSNSILDDLEKEVTQLIAASERRKVREILACQIEEYLCDEIGRHLLGPAFDFALIKFLVQFARTQSSGTHPSDLNRIYFSLERLDDCMSDDLQQNECLQTMSDVWRDILVDDATGKALKPENTQEDKIAKDLVADSLKHLKHQGYPSLEWLMQTWYAVTAELSAFRPPFEKVSGEPPVAISPIEALIATVIYYYGGAYKHKDRSEFFQSSCKSDDEKSEMIHHYLAEHLRYAISLYEFTSKAQSLNKGKLDQFYTASPIWKLRDKSANPIVITPSIDPNVQYGNNSVDLRLGQFFLIHRPTRYTHIQPNSSTENSEYNIPLDVFYDEVCIPVGKDFILHPHQFILAGTLEYICLPSDFYALVLGRSTWGRLGLNIATATAVQAGYRGCLTLELRNLGETPLPLTIGTRIAQLCLVKGPAEQTAKDQDYFVSGGKYVGSVKPEVPKIQDDPDWDLLKKTLG